MAKEVRLPRLGQTMEEGTVVNCLIKEGDQVQKGDVIFEVETDKATLEMESPIEGFVKQILVQPDQAISVGEPMLILGPKDENVPQDFIESLLSEQSVLRKNLSQKSAQVATIPIEMKNAGSSAKITEKDIKDAFDKHQTISYDQIKLGQSIPVNRLQKITIQKMLNSKREIPCFYLTVKTDVTSLVELRDEWNKDSDTKYSFNDFIIKAIAIGLEKYPLMTGQLEGDMINVPDSVNVGLAIAIPDGLVAPILKDVDKKDIKQISSDSKVLIEKSRNYKLAPEDLEGGCMTVSNLGSLGVDSFIPIVVPGQCSIIGVGKINEICVPDNGTMVIRKQMNLTLSVDHKVVNGAYAAQFLDFVHKLLEDVSNFEIDK